MSKSKINRKCKKNKSFKNKKLKIKGRMDKKDKCTKQMNTHRMKLSEPWYTYVRDGKKNIEGRIYDDKRKLLKIGDKIIFTDENSNNEIKKEITDLKIFENFDSAIRYAKLKNILPGISTYKEGVKLYNSIPGYAKKSKKFGVILIYIST